MTDNAKHSPRVSGADLPGYLPEDDAEGEDFLWGADNGGRQSDAPQDGGAGNLNSANEAPDLGNLNSANGDRDLGDSIPPGRTGGAPIEISEKMTKSSPEDEKKEAESVRAESLNILGKVGNFGLFLLIAIIFGYFIGDLLDSFFGTKPVFAVFWIGCAVIASFRELWRSVREAKRIGDGN